MKEPWVAPKVTKARPGRTNVEHLRKLIESRNATGAILKLLVPR
jgi:hypothetical protein